MVKLVVSFVLIGIVLIMGCTTSNNSFPKNSPNNLSNATFHQTTAQPTKNTCVVDLSELVIIPEDLPEGYVISDRGERLKSDVSNYAKNLGWITGYYIDLEKQGENMFQVTYIYQWISKYPLENITKVIDTPYVSWRKNATVEELSDPKIGDRSRAYRISYETEFTGNLREYVIEFTKMDIYEGLRITGTVVDYDLLKNLAKKAADKIK